MKSIEKAGLNAQAIHGSKSQNARQLALKNFKERKTRILVATDIPARGIDIDELSHVINFDLPEVPETYVHRIGRTGRAGLGGIAISFYDQEEKPLLKQIQKLISKSVPVVEGHPFPLVEMPLELKETAELTRKSVASKANTQSHKRGTGSSSSKNNARKNDKARDYSKKKRKDNWQ